jgi:hypothetical protein
MMGEMLKGVDGTGISRKIDVQRRMVSFEKYGNDRKWTNSFMTLGYLSD